MSNSFFIALFTIVGIVLLTVKPRNLQYPVNLKKFGLASLGRRPR